MAFAVSAQATAAVAATQASASAGRRTAAARAVAAPTPVRSLRSFAARQQSLTAAGRRAASIRASAAVRAAAVEAGLQEPHGGVLVDLMTAEADKASVKASATKTMELSDRNACDVELLIVGGFSPMKGFVSEADYTSIVTDMKMTDGTMFGLPIVLDTDSEDITVGDKVLLTYKGEDLAVLTVEEKYVPNKPLEALNCYGTSSLEHPGVQMISMERGRYYLSGPVQGLKLPTREFPCQTPAEVRSTLPAGKDVVAFQCRNPIHRAHYELFTRALDAENVGEGAVCLVHPTCGPTQDDDIPGIVRYRTYEVLKEEVNNPQIRWAYLPYSMHMAGPREAIQHMIIRKNYGCTHFIIGRDMAGSKSSLDGEDFYGAYDAQDLANKHAEELGVKTVPSLNVVYTEEEGYVTADVAKEKGLNIKKLSGTQFRKMLRAGDDIPEWFAFKSVVKVLREA
mmetsp:Transcript_21907/g.57083  ORF Transcript_21907/g.57083 Transcript_21907/m.57083 type:complete len:453 (+) Transcript_21907:105-1463(+)